MEELIKNELRKIIGEQYDGSFFEPITGVYNRNGEAWQLIKLEQPVTSHDGKTYWVVLLQKWNYDPNDIKCVDDSEDVFFKAVELFEKNQEMRITKMEEKIYKILEDWFDKKEKFPLQKLTVEENGEIQHFENVRIIGDADCWDVNEFYQYMVHDDKVYKVYFEVIPDQDLDMIDYEKSYKIVDVTDEFDLED